ncbi:O-antigen ligase family protein [Hydrotalea flava]|uniref:O-antigen ligase family protein n=1 Tax=Hydrotalea flava TaxID=714549 RepID=UPI00142EEBF7|nr:O-antigen ligase family protein [Hydrotalea flava]
MFKKTTNRNFLWQQPTIHWLLTGLFVLMLLGLLFSRALLSISMAVWFITIIAFQLQHPFPKEKHPLLYWSIMPLGLFVVGAWQLPFQKDTYDFLLNLCTYPIAFFAVRLLYASIDGNKIIRIWIVVAFLSSIYPLSWYVTHFQEAVIKYGSGQSMPVWMDHDHIRYSIFLCSAFALLLFHYPFSNKFRLPVVVATFLLIVFLSVRTAWVILAIMLLFIPFLKTIPYRKWLTIGIIAIACCSYFIFPTVQKKIAYTLYDWQQFKPAVFNSNYSDGARRNLNDIAVEAIQHKSYNVGWAGVAPTMQQYGKKYFPQQPMQFGWPFNQWLFWLLGSGWIGMLLWSTWLLYPILWGIQQQQFGITAWTIAISASCLVESNLNFQFGVFLHAWPLAMMALYPAQDNKR